MKDSTKRCEKHDRELRKKPGSSFYYPCPLCAYEKAISMKSKAKPMFNWGTGSKSKPSEKSKAMSKADRYFSRYIRLKHRHSVHEGGVIVCQCYTCGALKSITNIDCGHFVNRGSKTVRYDENNARPQCKRCNRYRSGEHNIFENNLIKELGEDEVIRIKRLGLDTGEDNTIFYNEQADKYRKLINELCKEQGIVNPFKG